MAICWPTQAFTARTFKLCVLTRWDFNFCVRSSPLRGRVERWLRWVLRTCRIVDSSVGWGLKKGMIFDKLSGNDWRVEIFLTGLRFKLPSPVVATQFLKSLPLRHSLLQPPEHRWIYDSTHRQHTHRIHLSTATRSVSPHLHPHPLIFSLFFPIWSGRLFALFPQHVLSIRRLLT